MPWLRSSFADFSQACLQERLPGSVIIAGRSEAGAFELAVECARFYLCENRSGGQPCGQCRSCQLFAAAAHPDFIIARASLPEEAEAGLDLTNDPARGSGEAEVSGGTAAARAGRRSVRIDTMRRLIDWLQLSNALPQGKVALIGDAHTMSEGSANAILKSFEEPPRQTLMIVVSQSLASLLPTIRSRAYKIVLREPLLQEGLDYLTLAGFTGRRALTALALSRNAPLGAVQLLHSGIDQQAVRIISLLAQAVESGRDSELISTLLALGAEGQVMILGELVHELLKYKAGCRLEELPLLDQGTVAVLCRLPAEHLFAAHDELRHFVVKAPFIPPRAPAALLRAWVQALHSLR